MKFNANPIDREDNIVLEHKGVRQTWVGIKTMGHWANHLTTVSHNCLICKLMITPSLEGLSEIM